MQIDSLEKLRRNDDGIYEFYIKQRPNTKAIPFFIFELTDRHDMRIDLVSLDLYESTDFIDVLCNINNILNPLTIQNGDIMFYTDAENIQEIQDSREILNDIKDTINSSNIGKQYKQDKARQNDITKRRQTEKDKKFIPPNILDVGTENIEIPEDGPDFSPKDGQIQKNNIIIKPSF